MPSYRHHDFGNLYVQFDVKFPPRHWAGSGEQAMARYAQLERILPPRQLPDPLPSEDMMSEAVVLEDADASHQARAQGHSAMDEDEDAKGAMDLYGNEVTDAVVKYKLDADGSLYEVHSPRTDLARLAPPKS